MVCEVHGVDSYVCIYIDMLLAAWRFNRATDDVAACMHAYGGRC